MNTENMKLLDLQTGKYLELGKEWGYFGEFITLIKISNEIIKCRQYTISISPTGLPDCLSIKVEKIVNEFKICIHNHTDPIINEIAEKVGAVIYGGRYILLFSEQDTSIHNDNHCYKNGDVVKDGQRHGYVAICTANTHYSSHNNVLDIPNFQDSCDCGFLSYKYEIVGNIFEEHSKQLRNEPNKFEELLTIFK